MHNILVSIINTLANLFVIIIIINSALSYFLPPFHPVRSALDRIIEPLLTPIRRVVPPLGMIDLSPLILIILIEILASVLIRIV